MPHKTPDFITVVLGFSISIFGGLARWYENGLFGKKFEFAVFAFDIVMSGIAGVLVYWFVWDLGQPDSVCAMSAAITGNIGSRIFDICRVLIRKRTGLEVEDSRHGSFHNEKNGEKNEEMK